MDDHDEGDEDRRPIIGMTSAQRPDFLDVADVLWDVEMDLPSARLHQKRADRVALARKVAVELLGDRAHRWR